MDTSNWLADAYKKALDTIHGALSPASASRPNDPTGLKGRIGSSKAKDEAVDAITANDQLDDADKGNEQRSK